MTRLLRPLLPLLILWLPLLLLPALASAEAPTAKYRPAPLPPLSYTVQRGDSLQMNIIKDLKIWPKGVRLIAVGPTQLGSAVIQDNLLYYIPWWQSEGLDSFWVFLERDGGYGFAVQVNMTVVPPPPPGLSIPLSARFPGKMQVQLALHAGNETLAVADSNGPDAYADLELPASIDDDALIWASASAIDPEGRSLELRVLGHRAGALRDAADVRVDFELDALSTAAFALLQRQGWQPEDSAASTRQLANALDPEQVLRAAALLELVHRQGCCLPAGAPSAFAALQDAEAQAWLEDAFGSDQIAGAEQIVIAHEAQPLDLYGERRLPLRRAAASGSVRTDGVFGFELASLGSYGPHELRVPARRTQLGITPQFNTSGRYRSYQLDQPFEFEQALPLQCAEPPPMLNAVYGMYGFSAARLVRMLDLELVAVSVDAWPLDANPALPAGCHLDFDALERQRHSLLIGQERSPQPAGYAGSAPTFLHIELPVPGADGHRLQAARIAMQPGSSACELQAEGFEPQCEFAYDWDADGRLRGLRMGAYSHADMPQYWDFHFELLRQVSAQTEWPDPVIEPVVAEWQVRTQLNWGELGVHTSLGLHGYYLPAASLGEGWLESSDSAARAGLRTPLDWRSFLYSRLQWPAGITDELAIPGAHLAPANWRVVPVHSEGSDQALRMESSYDPATGSWYAQCPQPQSSSCQLQQLREWELLGNAFSSVDGSPDPQGRVLVRERFSSRDAADEWQQGDWRLKIYRNHGFDLPLN